MKTREHWFYDSFCYRSFTLVMIEWTDGLWGFHDEEKDFVIGQRICFCFIGIKRTRILELNERGFKLLINDKQ